MDKQKCGINKKTCMGYKDGYCVSIENCLGKHKYIDNSYRAKMVENGIYKDSVVLSREEYEKLTTPRLTKINHKPLDEKALMQMLQQSIYYVPNDDCSIEILPTRAEIEKETAEKIAKYLFSICILEDIPHCMETYFKKQFGVEIKE